MNIEWDKLGFEFMPTRSNVRASFKDGKWSELKLYNTYDITMSVAANCMHYGQAIFEGMKAFRMKDGRIGVFRPQMNAKRFNNSAERILMETLPEEMFLEAIKMVIKDNADYIPPYGTDGSLYIRPVMFGTSSQIGVSPSFEYEFVMMVMPAGPYYKGGIKPVDALIFDALDRAAPHGTGNIKCAGNYAASLYSSKMAKKAGCPVALFLDPATHEYIDEFGTSNFFGITKDGKYVTPESPSVLPSVTNDSLLTLAQDLGIEVERRKIHKSELADFAEVGACGTAVVITPVHHIYYKDQVFTYGDTIGEISSKLYYGLKAIQYGEAEDKHNWMFIVD